MPPKRSAENTSKAKSIKQEKPPRKKRIKVEKPKLKNPTIIKVKIRPWKNLPSCNIPASSTPVAEVRSEAQSEDIDIDAAAKKIELAIDATQFDNNGIQEAPAKKKCVKRQISPNDNLLKEPVKKNLKKKLAIKPTKSTAAKPIKKSISSNNNKLKLVKRLSSVKSLLNNSQKLEVVKEKDKCVGVIPSKEGGIVANLTKSRKPSSASDQSSLSPTTDNSSSSTTTCVTVTSNDVVQSNKLCGIPIGDNDKVLKPIDSVESTTNSSDSDSSDSSETCTNSSSSSDSSSSSSSDDDSVSLTSSTLSCGGSPKKTVQIKTDNDDTSENQSDKESKPKIDIDFLKQFTQKYSLSENEKEMSNNISWPEEERSILTFCQEMHQIMQSPINEPLIERKPDKVVDKEVSKQLQPAEDNVLSKINIVPEYIDETYARKSNVECAQPLKSLIVPNDHSETGGIDEHDDRHEMCINNDDDVLSLIAESICSLESSKISDSGASNCALPPDSDEYVKEPISTENRYQQNNNFSRFTDNSLCNRPKAVCQKQNDGSTSFHKDTKDTSQVTSKLDHITDPKSPSVPEARKPWSFLLSHRYKQSTPTKCHFLRGVCFFNLTSNCRNSQCRFPHCHIEQKELLNRLSIFPENILISDYMLTRSIPCLRRCYGLLFAREFQSRGMTRVLLEMVIDFTVRARADNMEDSEVRSGVTDIALQHLNCGVDLNTCRDLLCFTVGNDRLLCDKLMEALAENQNFSSLKLVFLNLTNFVLSTERTLDVSVANNLVDRVCLMPFHQDLVQGLCRLLFHMNKAIFDNFCMRKFEAYILCWDKDFYEQFMFKRKSMMIHSETTPTERIAKNTEMHNNLIPSTKKIQKRHTSPENTRMDNTFMPKKNSTVIGNSEITRAPKIANNPETLYNPAMDAKNIQIQKSFNYSETTKIDNMVMLKRKSMQLDHSETQNNPEINYNLVPFEENNTQIQKRYIFLETTNMDMSIPQNEKNNWRTDNDPVSMMHRQRTISNSMLKTKANDNLMMHNQCSDNMMMHKQRSENLIMHKQRSDNMMMQKQYSDNLMTHKQHSDNLMTHKQQSDNLMMEKQHSENLMMQKQYSDNLMAHKQHSDNLMMEKQRSDNLMMQKQYSDNLMMHKQRSDNLMIHKQLSDNSMMHNQCSDSMMMHKRRSDNLMMHKQRSDNAPVLLPNILVSVRQRFRMEYRPPPQVKRDTSQGFSRPLVPKHYWTWSIPPPRVPLNKNVIYEQNLLRRSEPSNWATANFRAQENDKKYNNFNKWRSPSN